MQGKTTIVTSILVGVGLGWVLHAFWVEVSWPQTKSDQVLPAEIRIADVSIRGDRQRLELPGSREADAGLYKDKADFTLFSALLNTALTYQGEGNFSGSVETLLQASLAISNASESAEFESTLARTMDQAARELIAQERYGVLDQLYERLTLELEEYAEYYLKLGLLRIRMGNEVGAFQPLAQIQNHSQYGAQARRLLIQLEESQTVAATLVEEIPLTVRAGQYAVEAIIDPDINGRGTAIRLLVDTGAAITAINASVLSRLGYNLNERSEYFATANGVVEAPVVTLSSLSIGESSVNRLSIGALNLDAQNNIDGLLGMNFLRHFKFRLNQDSQKLELQRRED